MYHLYGTFPCKFDSKGRLRLPTDFLDLMPVEERDVFVVKRGFETCLVLYPKKVWDRESEKVSVLNDFDEESREFKRQWFYGVSVLKRDSADRLNFPNHHLEWAQIQSDVVFNCVNDKVEIWDKDVFDEKMSISREKYSRLGQKLLGGNPLQIPREGQQTT